MIAPIQYDNQITGAILSLQKLADNSKRPRISGRYAAAWICGADQI